MASLIALRFSFLHKLVQADCMEGTEPLLIDAVYEWQSSKNIRPVSSLP